MSRWRDSQLLVCKNSSDLTKCGSTILKSCWLLSYFIFNVARRTSWGWWDNWDDNALQTQASKFEPLRSETEPATSRSRRLPAILIFTHERGRKMCVSLKLECPSGGRTRDLPTFQAGSFNHCTRALALHVKIYILSYLIYNHAKRPCHDILFILKHTIFWKC